MNDIAPIFTSEKAKMIGLKLQEIIESTLENIEGNIVGGAKVKLLLYSRNGPNNVLCGIQEGSKETCMLYVHHVNGIEHERIKFSGKGKHAQRIKFNTVSEVNESDIRWLVTKADENAPF